MIGIGGAGMSALAHLFLERGDAVTGSDSNASQTIDALVEGGASVRIGHDAEALQEADLVVRSTAIDDTNPELQVARAHGIRVMSRGEAAAADL